MGRHPLLSAHQLELGLLFFGATLGATALGVFLGRRVRHLSDSLKEPFGVLQARCSAWLASYSHSVFPGRFPLRGPARERRPRGERHRHDVPARPDPGRAGPQPLVDLRVGYARSAIRLSNQVPGSDEAGDARAQEERIERRLWALAGEALDAAPTASAPRLYVETLNEMIDGETARVAALATGSRRPFWRSRWSARRSRSGCLRPTWR